MVIDLAVDQGGDLVLDGQNDLKLVDGDEELLQCVRDIILTNLGEWFLNPEHGFPRYRVLGEKFDRERVTEELIAAVLQEPRVQSVEEITWDFDRKTRKLSGTFRFVDQNGNVIEGVF